MHVVSYAILLARFYLATCMVRRNMQVQPYIANILGLLPDRVVRTLSSSIQVLIL